MDHFKVGRSQSTLLQVVFERAGCEGEQTQLIRSYATILLCTVVFSLSSVSLAATDPRCGTTDQTPASRFVAKGDEIYDQETKVTWARCSLEQTWVEGKGCVGTIRAYSFGEVPCKINAKWRLPTTSEITSIAHICYSVSSLKEVDQNINSELGLGVWISDKAIGDGRPVVYSNINGKNNVYVGQSNSAMIKLVRVSVSDGVSLAVPYAENLGNPYLNEADRDELVDLGSFASRVTEIKRMSSDGTQFSGVNIDSSGHVHIFRWNKTEGLRDTEVFSDKGPHFSSITSNGTAGVGFFQRTEAGTTVIEPFRWEHGAGFHIFDTFEGEPFSPTVISDDGTIVFGQVNYDSNRLRPVRWTPGNGYFPISAQNPVVTFPLRVSDDGRSIVLAGPAPADQQPKGPSRRAIGNIYAWQEHDGPTRIGSFDLGFSRENTLVISHDGLSLGVTRPGDRLDDPTHMMCQKKGADLVDLGSIAGRDPTINAVSDNCTVIVGHTNVDATWHAFIWTENHALQELGTLGGRSANASVLSADGTVIAGIIYMADSRAHIVIGSPVAWLRHTDKGASHSATP
jgi:uncharacterized membrane protein